MHALAVRLTLLALCVLAAWHACAAPPAEPAPESRSREAFIDALRAHYETVRDVDGNPYKVVCEPGRLLRIEHGGLSQVYGSELLVPGDPAPPIACAGWLNTAAADAAPVLEGKVVWLEFSATWCGPCVESMPEVQKLYERFRDGGLEVVVLTDEPGDVFAPYVEEHGYTMPVACGVTDHDITRRFGVNGWPTLFLLRRDGRIAYVGDPRDKGLDRVIDGLLEEEGTRPGSERETDPPEAGG